MDFVAIPPGAGIAWGIAAHIAAARLHCVSAVWCSVPCFAGGLSGNAPKLVTADDLLREM